MSRIVSATKGQATGQRTTSSRPRRRLSAGAALGLWLALSLLGWLAIYFGLTGLL
ncbi:MAG: hypothetical protein WD341_02010 [Tistlia sp.]|uniref:hypothetical protein n=1 Tax=Tistlia sp. TaxID=3057121 RepID=UPI0034A5076A